MTPAVQQAVERLRDIVELESRRMPAVTLPKDLLVADLRAVLAALDDAERELETERMRLAACGVVALSNTPETAAKAREMHADYRSASCDDVAHAVDREMDLRAKLAAAEARLAEMREALEEMHKLGRYNDEATTSVLCAPLDLSALRAFGERCATEAASSVRLGPDGREWSSDEAAAIVSRVMGEKL